MPTAKSTVKTDASTPAKTAVKAAVKAVTRRGAQPKATASKPDAAPVPSASAATSPAKVSLTRKAAKPTKVRKPLKVVKAPKLRNKPVRDSFTMPEADFALVATLKARTLSAKRETKKSELLRAGLHALAAMDTMTLVAVLGALEPVKVGRPKSGH
jgi:hypothetical protein